MCAKVSYFSRREARRACRRHHDGHMNAYRCREHGAWHIGHLAPIVIRGLRSRAEVYW